MNDGYSYDDFISKLNIEEVLRDAGYRQNRRDGIRYPSYIRVDESGARIRGDKFIVTQGGKCCFRPPEQKVYNVISFIKAYPALFTDNKPGMSPDRLVNLVCNRLLNNPIENRETGAGQAKREVKPFSINDYDIKRFNLADKEAHKPFYPYFKYRGINLVTQRAFAKHFFLATRRRQDGREFTNLSFPLVLPSDTERIVGLEERGRPKIDGSGGYKGKAAGSNSSEGLWIANLTEQPVEAAEEILWFESAYDAMAAYQIHPRAAVYVPTGGTPTERQMRGLPAQAPHAGHYLGFDNDEAGQAFVRNFKRIAQTAGVEAEKVKEYHPDGDYKDWNDALLNRRMNAGAGGEETRSGQAETNPENRTAYHR
ncbi:MAG: toprim domain-containing protein [Prevotella sp.]|nr:toprim domain-containing protein [Prevotella sp.]